MKYFAWWYSKFTSEQMKLSSFSILNIICLLSKKIKCKKSNLRYLPLQTVQVAYKMNRDLHLKFWCSSYHCIKCSTKIVTNRVDDNNKDSDKELDIFCNSIVFTMTGVCHWFFTCSIFQSQNWTEWVRLLELGQLQLSQCQNYRTHWSSP